MYKFDVIGTVTVYISAIENELVMSVLILVTVPWTLNMTQIINLLSA